MYPKTVSRALELTRFGCSWLCPGVYDGWLAGVFLCVDRTFRAVGAGARPAQGSLAGVGKLLHGQLLKGKGRAVFAMMRMAWGKRKALSAVLKAAGFRTLIQTAFVERVNLTLRRGVAPLMRKTWAYAQTTAHLALHVDWWPADYHFVRPHESLLLEAPGLRRKRKRSPAMAAGLTARRRPVGEILSLPLWPAPA